LLLLVVLPLVYFVYIAILQWRRIHQRYHSLPWAEGWKPLLGHLTNLNYDWAMRVTENALLTRKPVVVQLLGTASVVLSDSADIDQHARLADKHATFSQAGVELLSMDVFFPALNVPDHGPLVRVVRHHLAKARFGMVDRLRRAIQRSLNTQIPSESKTFPNIYNFVQRLVSSAALAAIVGEQLLMAKDIEEELFHAAMGVMRAGETGIAISVLGMPRGTNSAAVSMLDIGIRVVMIF
jgi:hypothetical protein